MMTAEKDKYREKALKFKEAAESAIQKKSTKLTSSEIK
jgi:hypothetical protein